MITANTSVHSTTTLKERNDATGSVVAIAQWHCARLSTETLGNWSASTESVKYEVGDKDSDHPPATQKFVNIGQNQCKGEKVWKDSAKVIVARILFCTQNHCLILETRRATSLALKTTSDTIMLLENLRWTLVATLLVVKPGKVTEPWTGLLRLSCYSFSRFQSK